MSNVAAGYTFSDNEGVVANSLHRLVDDATLAAMAPADLYTGTDYARTTTSPTATLGDNVVTGQDASAGDLNSTNGEMKFHLGAFNDPSAYQSMLEHPYTITLMNKAGSELTRGMAVVMNSTASEPSVMKSDSLSSDFRFIGVAYETIADNAYGRILVRGAIYDLPVTAPAGTSGFGAILRAPSTGGDYLTVIDDPTSITTFGAANVGQALMPVPNTPATVTIAALIWR